MAIGHQLYNNLWWHTLEKVSRGRTIFEKHWTMGHMKLVQGRLKSARDAQDRIWDAQDLVQNGHLFQTGFRKWA